jgi:hypothetical protein
MGERSFVSVMCSTFTRLVKEGLLNDNALSVCFLHRRRDGVIYGAEPFDSDAVATRRHDALLIDTETLKPSTVTTTTIPSNVVRLGTGIITCDPDRLNPLPLPPEKLNNTTCCCSSSDKGTNSDVDDEVDTLGIDMVPGRIARAYCCPGKNIIRPREAERCFRWLVHQAVLHPEFREVARLSSMALTSNIIVWNTIWSVRGNMIPGTPLFPIGTIVDAVFPMFQQRGSKKVPPSCVRFSDATFVPDIYTDEVLYEVECFTDAIPLLFGLSAKGNRTLEKRVFMTESEIRTLRVSPELAWLRFNSDLCAALMSGCKPPQPSAAARRTTDVARHALRMLFEPHLSQYDSSISYGSASSRRVAGTDLTAPLPSVDLLSDEYASRIPHCILRLHYKNNGRDSAADAHPRYNERLLIMSFLFKAFPIDRFSIMRIWQQNFFGTAYQDLPTFERGKYGMRMLQDVLGYCSGVSTAWACKHAVSNYLCPYAKILCDGGSGTGNNIEDIVANPSTVSKCQEICGARSPYAYFCKKGH